jgi:tetratricopeptide (TPR) repeat protein
MRFHRGLLLAIVAVVPAFTIAQTNGGGQVSFVNSGSKAAQGPFLHGLAMLHNFEYEIAAEDFRQAESIDPDFAMAYWGEAMTHNHPVWNQQNRHAAMRALSKLGTSPEARLAKAKTKREKDYLGTLDILYGDGPKQIRDQRYADAMAALHQQYPDDVNAAAFYALALLGSTEGVRNERVYMQAAGVLMPLFYSHPRHPGIAHYLIHSCDDPIHAPLALPAARAYSKIAPDAGHAQHMTSHIFLALGMWKDVVQANETAMRVVNEQLAAQGKPASHCGHYAYWLEYGYLETSQTDKAKQVIQGCREDASKSVMSDRAKNVTDPDDSKLFSYTAMKNRFLVDTAQWDSDSAFPLPTPGENPMLRFSQAYGRGLAAAEKGDLTAARKSLSDMDALLPRLPEMFDRDGSAPDEPERLVPAIEQQQVQALILAGDGKLDEAVVIARKAAEEEMRLPYAFGPPDPAKPSYELLAELLLKQNQPRLALEACRQSLLRAPNRRQSLALLERASVAVNATTSAATR